MEVLELKIVDVDHYDEVSDMLLEVSKQIRVGRGGGDIIDANGKSRGEFSIHREEYAGFSLAKLKERLGL